MSQNDFNIANQTFPNTRSDLNSALQALASTSSGTSAPSTTYANQLWYDSSANILYIRNEDNDANITILALDQSNDTVEYFQADSIRTALIEFTDGDDALSIADGGALTTSGNLSIGGSNNELRFMEGANFVGFEAPALTGDQIFVLPSADGSANQVIKTDGSGNLSFTNVTPADSSVTSAKLSGALVTPSSLDLNGNELILDADADTSITADTDDQIDFKIANTDHFKLVSSSGDTVVQPTTDAKDIIFKQFDGTSVLAINDGAYAEFLGAGIVPEATLTDASTITWNALTQSVCKVTLGANRTMGLASNGVAGAFISILVIQDGTGSRTLSWNAGYEFTADEAPTLTTTANKGDLFVFRYNGSKWLETGRNLDLTLS